MKTLILTIMGLLVVAQLSAQEKEMVLVKGGTYTPLYGAIKNEAVSVQSFYMDVTPVTHAEFLEFIREFPNWSKPNVKKLFADERYLDMWPSEMDYPKNLQNSPVTNVSWFAAKAYCECQGKRLPYVDEWEYAAMASQTSADAREDSLYNVSVLRGYEKPKTYLNQVGQQPKNYWGLQDLHGMVWEWTMDFNAIIITGESRNYGNTDQGLFCASGALGANDLMNYAAFMRYAMRSSLKANYNLKTLGFRCVKDVSMASVLP